MLFNSIEFIFLFLPITFLIYFLLNKKKYTIASKIWLTFSSLFFYSWWNIIYLPLILSSIIFNYFITSEIIKKNNNENIFFSKKFLLIFGLSFNILLLIYFKYMDFFIENTNLLTNSNIELLHLALPLAISFFTLQQVAFLVDCYEGLVEEKNFIDYVLFVTFFPQLIAGPIVHHQEVMPQFFSIKNKVKNYKNIALGIFIFSIGLFKKVVIADTFAVWVSNGFDTANTLNFFEAWATSLSYTIQLYFDFSGYTDMAIGAALLFNIRLPQNFNSPLKSSNIIEFWTKWHITLSNFITTYLYTPIIKQFSKITFHKAMLATLLSFLIVGFWHGASWMFVIFGALHGTALIINHYWKKYWKKKLKIHISKYFFWFLTFNFVNFANVFFRANNIDDALKVLSGMFSIDKISISKEFSLTINYLINIDLSLFISTYQFHFNIYIFWAILATLFIILNFKNTIELANEFVPNIKNLFITLFFLSISLYFIIYMQNRITEFLYFDF